jgi:LacI family transcriptional regulator
MEELDYHPNAVAQSLRTQKTNVIGAVVSDITNPFFATLIRGAEDAAIEAGYSLIVCNSDESLEKEDRYVRLLKRRQIDGLIISPVGDGSHSVVHELPNWKVPFVFVDRRVEDIDADAVLSDNVEGAYQATHHLIEQGNRRIGLVLGIKGATTTEERFAGYRKALDEAEITFVDELVVYGGYRIEGGQKSGRRFLSLSEPPTAIFSTNNLMTIGVLQELFHRQVRIPEEIAVVSFDDLNLGELFQPPLTSITQDPYEIGRTATGVLLERFNDSKEGTFKEIRVPVTLRVRRST